MKKFVPVILSALLSLTMFAMPAMAEDETAPVRKVGVLTMLNMTEEEMAEYVDSYSMITNLLREEGILISTFSEVSGNIIIPEYEVVYFDTLDSMLEALQAGDISGMWVYENTGDYILTPELAVMNEVADEDDLGYFAHLVLDRGILSNDFAFMMNENDSDLRDEFNDAIEAIKEDGTLDKLVEEHIDKAVADKSATPAVELPHFEGADTIKVAVTGILPPMDYVDPSGNPAGFSTAVLAEIGNRLGKNIEIVVVDSVGRAEALASGEVDAVFWTRTNERSNELRDDNNFQQALEKIQEKVSEEEYDIMLLIADILSFTDFGSLDMPEGTIITDAYFSDRIVPVFLQSYVEQVQEAMQ
jgi:ABC-type amino acid transport substrate-binding protein